MPRTSASDSTITGYVLTTYRRGTTQATDREGGIRSSASVRGPAAADRFTGRDPDIGRCAGGTRVATHRPAPAARRDGAKRPKLPCPRPSAPSPSGKCRGFVVMNGSAVRIRSSALPPSPAGKVTDRPFRPSIPGSEAAMPTLGGRGMFDLRWHGDPWSFEPADSGAPGGRAHKCAPDAHWLFILPTELLTEAAEETASADSSNRLADG